MNTLERCLTAWAWIAITHETGHWKRFLFVCLCVCQWPCQCVTMCTFNVRTSVYLYVLVYCCECAPLLGQIWVICRLTGSPKWPGLTGTINQNIVWCSWMRPGPHAEVTPARDEAATGIQCTYTHWSLNDLWLGRPHLFQASFCMVIGQLKAQFRHTKLSAWLDATKVRKKISFFCFWLNQSFNRIEDNTHLGHMSVFPYLIFNPHLTWKLFQSAIVKAISLWGGMREDTWDPCGSFLLAWHTPLLENC